MSHKGSFLRQPKDKPEVLISGFSTWRDKTWNQNSISEIFFIFFRTSVCKIECIACQLGPLGSELLRISTIIGEIWDQLCKSYKTWLEKGKTQGFQNWREVYSRLLCLKTCKGNLQESFCQLQVARKTLAVCMMFYCFLQIEYLIQLNSLCSFCYCCCCVSSYQPPLCSSLPLRLEHGSYQKALESPILVAPILKAPMKTISRKEWSFQWNLCLLTTRSYFNLELMTSTEINSQ